MRTTARARLGRPLSTFLLHVRTPLYRNAYALMLSNILSSGLGIVYWALAARLYGAEQLGTDSALISVLTLLTGLSQLNLRVALNRLVPEAGRATPRLVAACYVASVGVASIVSVGFVAAAPLVDPGGRLFPGGVTVGLAAILVLSTVGWTVFNLQDGILSGLRRAVWIPVENGLYSLAKIVLLVVFALSLPAHGILTSFFLPMAAAIVAVNVVLARRWIPEHVEASGDRALTMGRERVIRFIAGDYVASLFVLAYTSLLPLIVVSQLGAGAAAYFYIVWISATSLNLIPLGLSASFTVETVASRGDLEAQTRRMLVHMARVLIPIVLLVVLGAGIVLQVFGPAYAAEGTLPLRLLAISVIPYSVEVLFFGYARVQGRSREILLVQACLAVAILGLGYLFLTRAGIAGLAFAWLLSHSAMAVVLLLTRLRPIVGPLLGSLAGAARR